MNLFCFFFQKDIATYTGPSELELLQPLIEQTTCSYRVSRLIQCGVVITPSIFFFQNTHNRHPIAQIAEIWGGFCQFIVSSICGLCNCRAVYMYHVYDILTYWTTLYRLLTVFAFSLTPQDWNRWYPANFMSPCNFMSPWFDIFTCPAVKILHFSGQFIKYMYLGENLARIHLSNWQFYLPQVYRAMTYVEPMNLSYISQGMAWASHVIFTLHVFSHLMLPLFLYFQIESYWTYELCHGKTLRQYHEEKDTNQVSYIKKVFDRIWPIMRWFFFFFFWGIMKIFMYILNSFNMEMAQVVEYLPHGRQWPMYGT